jgi:RHS repeat-associated protein
VDGTQTTYSYVENFYTRVEYGGGIVDHKLYVHVNGQAVAIEVDDAATTPTSARTRYVHRDHITSITGLVDTNGIERLSYDAFGLRRDAVDWIGPPAAAATEERGFTGHEHLDRVGLIHMNGRVYDPILGRMTSADPMLNGKDSQSYNAYTYAGNNPLRYRDPSGFQHEEIEEIVVTAKRPSGGGGGAPEEYEIVIPSALDSMFDRFAQDRFLQGQPVPLTGFTQSRTSVNPEPLEFPQVAGYGLLVSYETARRLQYMERIARMSALAQVEYDLAIAAGDYARARQIAYGASSMRNMLRTFTQEQLSPGGRYFSRTLEGNRSWESLLARYANNPDPLETITIKSGQSLPALKTLTNIGRVAGPASVIVGAAGGVYEYSNAAPEDKGRVAAEQIGGVAGGAIGGSAGLAVGTGAVVLLLGTNPPGWAVLTVGLLAGAAGGYYGSTTGEDVGGWMYDQSTTCPCRGLSTDEPWPEFLYRK